MPIANQYTKSIEGGYIINSEIYKHHNLIVQSNFSYGGVRLHGYQFMPKLLKARTTTVAVFHIKWKNEC